MNSRGWVATIAASCVLLAGCVDADDFGPGSERVEASAVEEEPEDPPTPESESTPAPEPGDDPPEPEVDEDQELDRQLFVEFDEPFTWEQDGIRVAVTGIGITDVTTDAAVEVTDGAFEEDTETVVGLAMQASNDSGRAIDLYLNQGSIQLGREQVESSPFLSDIFAGSGIRDGVDSDGQVLWELRTPWEEVVWAGELVFFQAGAHDAENYDAFRTEDIELPVSW